MKRGLPEMVLNSGEMSVLLLERQHRGVKTDPGQFPSFDCFGFGSNSEKNTPLPPGKSKKKKTADKILSLKEWVEEGDSKVTEQNHIINVNKNQYKYERSAKKITHLQNSDYIHVRARRGQATDSHSLAERVRREKISERMKYLQDLVPGCDKIIGKAGMLDEIINYVQSLQRQVEFLSIKLATVTPTLDNVENFFTKEMFDAGSSNFADNSLTPDMIIPAAYQLNQLQQLVTNVSAPLSNPDTFLDSFCFNQIQPPLNFGPELQNFYGTEFQQGTTISYPLQTFTGSMEGGGNLKMEM